MFHSRGMAYPQEHNDCPHLVASEALLLRFVRLLLYNLGNGNGAADLLQPHAALLAGRQLASSTGTAERIHQPGIQK